jgi:hypothetical protein
MPHLRPLRQHRLQAVQPVQQLRRHACHLRFRQVVASLVAVHRKPQLRLLHVHLLPRVLPLLAVEHLQAAAELRLAAERRPVAHLRLVLQHLPNQTHLLRVPLRLPAAVEHLPAAEHRLVVELRPVVAHLRLVLQHLPNQTHLLRVPLRLPAAVEHLPAAVEHLPAAEHRLVVAVRHRAAEAPLRQVVNPRMALAPRQVQVQVQAADLVRHRAAQVLALVVALRQVQVVDQVAAAQAADPVAAAHDQVRVTLAIVPVVALLKIPMVVELTMKAKMTQRQVGQRGLSNVDLRCSQ